MVYFSPSGVSFGPTLFNIYIVKKTKNKKRLAYNGHDLFFDNFSFYVNEFILYKLQIEITCLRLKAYGIKPVLNWKLKLT